MDKIEIQKSLLHELTDFRIPKWNESHTEEINILKCFPKHMRGTKEVKKALEELYKKEWILKYKKTGETHISLNIRKKNEIEEFLEK